MTPFDTATSSSRVALLSSVAIALESPAASASRNRRIAVLKDERTDLLRRRAFSLVLIRLIWDLIFATNVKPSGWVNLSAEGYQPPARRLKPRKVPLQGALLTANTGLTSPNFGGDCNNAALECVERIGLCPFNCYIRF
jgi:hypothetical protein